MNQAVFILVTSLFAFASAQITESPTLNDNMKKCNEKYEVPNATITDLKNYLEKTGQLPQDVPECVRCNLKCVADLEGVLNPNGSYDVEKSVATIKEGFQLSDQKTDEYRKYIEECNKHGTDYKGDEQCMTTFLAANCIQAKLALLTPKTN